MPNDARSSSTALAAHRSTAMSRSASRPVGTRYCGVVTTGPATSPNRGLPAAASTRPRVSVAVSEPVTGPRAPHGDGSGDHVRAVTRTVVGVGRDVDRVREHVRGGDTVAAEEGDRVAALVFEDALVADGVDGDLRAGLDAEYG